MLPWRFVWLLFLAFCLFPVRAGVLVQFRTAFGDMDVELYDHDKPITVQNFIRYTTNGLYVNEFAHRLVPGFVIQGGAYTITDHGNPTNYDFYPVTPYPPITNEYSKGTRYSNVFGTIAMAKQAGNTNSATSQWYFNLAKNTSLDAPDTNNLFVVFGHVLRGTNVLNTFNKFVYYSGTAASNVVVNVGSPLDSLPLLHVSPSDTIIADTNFVYMDISLLSVQIVKTNGSRQISWNSINGKTNLVEYTTNFPPNWKTLVTTNGNGNRIAVTDPAPTNQYRFYRVRVLY